MLFLKFFNNFIILSKLQFFYLIIACSTKNNTCLFDEKANANDYLAKNGRCKLKKSIHTTRFRSSECT